MPPENDMVIALLIIFAALVVFAGLSIVVMQAIANFFT